MHISAINNFNYTNYKYTNKKAAEQKQVISQPAFKGDSSRKLAIAMVPLAFLPWIQSCDKSCLICIDDSTHVIVPPCDTCPPSVNPDTTIYEPFRSPVIDTLRQIFGELGVDTSRGYLPLVTDFTDDLDLSYKRGDLDTNDLHKDYVYVDGKIFPWSDQYQDYLDNPDVVRVRLTLDNDKNLLATAYKLRQGANPQHLSPSDWREDRSQKFVIDRHNNQINVYSEAEDGNTIVYVGSMEGVPGGTSGRYSFENPYRTSHNGQIRVLQGGEVYVKKEKATP